MAKRTKQQKNNRDTSKNAQVGKKRKVRQVRQDSRGCVQNKSTTGLKQNAKTILFLKESNAIEGVYDDDSLQQAIKAWSWLIKQPKLVTSVVLKTHAILMKNHNIIPKEKGNYRIGPIYIAGREGSNWVVIPSNMQYWFNKANHDKYWEDIKESHVAYEHIHPFIDGNGRTGRMFMNWQRIKAGLPILIIKESKKWDYYLWFK